MLVQWSDSAVERKEAPTLATTRMTLENTMPDTQKATYYAPICMECPEQAIHRDGSRLALARDGGERERRVCGNGYGSLFGDEGSVLERERGWRMAAQLCECAKCAELYTLKG